MDESIAKAAMYERIVSPHMDAAWNLARWLVRDPHDAEDVMQEACVRAFRFIDSYRGGDPKSWVLSIVRNVSHTLHRKNRGARSTVALDEQADTIEGDSMQPLEHLEQQASAETLRAAIARLPIEYREPLILREFEQLSYKEIAQVTEVPMGTVMSRLARGRERLVALLTAPQTRKENQR
jgi:RNA polymerase sigma-70 factor (ECF subfamily)